LDIFRARCHQGIKALTTTHICPFSNNYLKSYVLMHAKLHYIHAWTYVVSAAIVFVCTNLYYIHACIKFNHIAF
jgi:hypothetical protein